MRHDFGTWPWRVRYSVEEQRLRYSLFGLITLGDWSLDECKLLPFSGDGLTLRNPDGKAIRLRGLGTEDAAELYKLLTAVKSMVSANYRGVVPQISL